MRVEFAFETAEAVVVEADVAQHLRGDLVVGIKALEFLLEVNAFHIEGANSRGNFGRDAAGDPGKVLALVETMGDLVFGGQLVFRVGVDDSGERTGGAFLVVDLGRNGVDGVDLHGHGQLVHVAVIENAAAGRDLKGALLLLFRALHVFVVANDLQPEETRGDGDGPEEKEPAHKPEARQLHRHGAW